MKSNKIKISILLPDLRGGGAERVSINLALKLETLGHDIEFVLMQAKGDFLPEAERVGSVFSLDQTQARHVPMRLARYLCEKKPYVLIANMWPLTTAAVIGRALSRQPCKLLLVEHTTLSRQYDPRGWLHNQFLLRASLWASYRWADAVAAVSQGSAADTARLAGLNANHVAVLHNPVPLPPIPATEMRDEANVLWGCQPGERMLTVGSFKKAKNYPLLLRSFAKCNRPQARLMLLGKGGLEPELRGLAQQLGISDRVIFAGFHADPSPFYATADLFVLSSDYEGLPTVIIEALHFGLRVVSTDCPSGPAEILENGRWGRLTPVGDAAALARAIDEALSSEVDHEALKRRAADFSPEIAARKYLDLLGLS